MLSHVLKLPLGYLISNTLVLTLIFALAPRSSADSPPDLRVEPQSIRENEDPQGDPEYKLNDLLAIEKCTNEDACNDTWGTEQFIWSLAVGTQGARVDVYTQQRNYWWSPNGTTPYCYRDFRFVYYNHSTVQLDLYGRANLVYNNNMQEEESWGELLDPGERETYGATFAIWNAGCGGYVKSYALEIQVKYGNSCWARNNAGPISCGGTNPNPGGNDTANNTPSGAQSITTDGQRIQGQIQPAGDVDYYSFNATNGFTYIIQTFGEMDSFLTLYATNGATILATNDDYNDSRTSRLQWTAPANGAYFYRINHYNIDTGTGTYDCSVTQSGGTQPTNTGTAEFTGTAPGSTLNDENLNISADVKNGPTPQELRISVYARRLNYTDGSIDIDNQNTFLLGRISLGQADPFEEIGTDETVELDTLPPRASYYILYVLAASVGDGFKIKDTHQSGPFTFGQASTNPNPNPNPAPDPAPSGGCGSKSLKNVEDIILFYFGDALLYFSIAVLLLYLRFRF